MSQLFRIEIRALGPQGCGKTRAIKALVEAIAKSSDFEWLDGRFLEYSNEETQDIKLKLRDGN